MAIELELDPTSSVLGRVTTLGVAYGLRLHALLDRLAALAPELAATAVISVPSEFDRVAVATPLTRSNDGVDRVRVLCGTCDPTQPARLATITKATTRSVNVELETLPGDDEGIACTVTGYGPRDRAADLGVLGEFGVSASVRGRLDTVLASLVGADRYIGLGDRATSTGEHAWTLHVAHANRDENARAATKQLILATAETLGVTLPQRGVVDGLHDALAGTRDSYSWLRVTDRDDAITLGVLWADVRWEDIVNVMMTFYPGRDTSTRLGAFAGAFGAASAAIELELGSSEPPRMRVHVTTNNGQG